MNRKSCYSGKNTTESERTPRAFKDPEVAADNEVVAEGKQKLLDEILRPENLNKAYKHVKAKGGAPGIDGINVRTELGKVLKENSETIIESIRNRKYRPKPVKRVLIPKDKPGEFRKLGIPTGQDRVIQQAIAQVLTPIYEEQFSNDSFGFRPGRSCQKAVKRVRKYANEGHTYVISLDLEKYFDTVPQMKLIEILQRTIKDNDLISLIHKFLKSGVIHEGLFEKTEEGMPQGGPLSPLLSNIMLNELDKELEKRELKFVRYADDTIIMCKSKRAALRVKDSITRFIEEKLKLRVNKDKTTVDYLSKVKYLGYGFYKTNRGFRFRPHRKSKDKLKTKLNGIFKQARGKSYKWLSLKLTQTLRGWINYFYLADMKKFLISLQEWINHRIRSHHWRRWKKVRTRFRNLSRLGIGFTHAIQMANTRKGPWRSSANPIIHKALSNKRLQKWGYPDAPSLYSNIIDKKLADFNARRIAYYS